MDAAPARMERTGPRHVCRVPGTRAEPHFPPLFTVAELTRLEHDPHMIHFTGSSTFSVADCLNQYCPGPTKPWVPPASTPRRVARGALDQTFMRRRPPLQKRPSVFCASRCARLS